MTNKEASFILANIDRAEFDEYTNTALDMAISALEQEPTIGQIRGKIKHAKDDLPLRYNDGLGMALEIIDKYTKGESE